MYLVSSAIQVSAQKLLPKGGLPKQCHLQWYLPCHILAHQPAYPVIALILSGIFLCVYLLIIHVLH
jgi:hypothetical protein